VNNVVLNNKGKMYVQFNDGSIKKSKVLMSDISTGHVVLVVDEDDIEDREVRSPVTFKDGSNEIGRNNIF